MRGICPASYIARSRNYDNSLEDIKAVVYWSRWIWTTEWRSQSPLPYRLAIPQSSGPPGTRTLKNRPVMSRKLWPIELEAHWTYYTWITVVDVYRLLQSLTHRLKTTVNSTIVATCHTTICHPILKLVDQTQFMTSFTEVAPLRVLCLLLSSIPV